MKLSMREPTGRNARRRDGLPRSSEYVVACLLRAELDSRGFVGISGTQMSAGTLVHSQWKRDMGDTAILDRDTQGRSKRNGDTNDIKRVEFPTILFIRDQSIPISRNHSYIKITQKKH